jgi:hypothetical protein
VSDASLETNDEDALPPPSVPPPPPPSAQSPNVLQVSEPPTLPAAAEVRAPAPVPLRPGQLTVAWQIMLAASWSAAFFAFAAVWKTSEEIGIGTWWLGPRAQPQPLLIRSVPFVITMLMGLLAVYNVRRIALMSITASIVVAIIAVLDISRSGGLAAIEFAIAASMLLVSVGALIASARRASTVPQ